MIKIFNFSATRPDLDKTLEYVRSGGNLVVWRLDRLSCSLKSLISMVSELEQAGVGLKSMYESIDATSNSDKLAFHFLGAIAEFGRNLIRERT